MCEKDTRIPAITIEVAALRAAVADVIGCISARAEIPVLSHVRIESVDGRLSILGTDLDRWVTRSLPVERDTDWRNFTLCLPAHALADILKVMPGATQLTLEAPHGEESRALLKSGRSRFRLVSLPAEEFPMPPSFSAAHTIDLPARALADAMAGVDHAISSEETRYYLNGIFLHARAEPEQLRFVATDGHRLARLGLTDPPEGASDWPDTIAPRQLVKQLARLLDEVVKAEKKDDDPAMVLVQADGGERPMLLIDLPARDGGELTVQAKSIDGTFPDYSRVIPASPPNAVTVEKGALERSVRIVSAIASDKTRAVKLEVGEAKILLTVASPELGDAQEEVPGWREGEGVTIGFDARYLLDALSALPADQVRLGYSDAGGPVLVTAPEPDIENDRLVQVLMPLKV